jgi:lysyl-tRNA synthetase class 1
MKKKVGESLFWADQLTRDIKGRKNFHYIDRSIKKFSKFTVKTSASISGVLHIGRLSDTIRSESVYRALKESGVKAELIWVAEDMDPLRKIPEGVPKKFEEHLGSPVTDIPDPWGCHKSYAEHHVSEYTKVIDEFVSTRMPRYSMREEYRAGRFNDYIRVLLGSMDTLRGILNRFRREPLSDTWSPWQPICENCGKIMTPTVYKFEDGKVHYKCKDYRFEKTVAKGCGHEGVNDPLKDEGKLVWKSEWAAQWARWNVCSEGAGKEYQVPGSAFWINGEISERILGFPQPVPIFYEHLIIDGQKMSASLGNVVYPKDWLEVAPPELLRFLYNKKLMKTRSFTWLGLPGLYNDYDHHGRIYFGKEKAKNPKEEKHMKRLFEISQFRKPERTQAVPFDFAAMVSSMFGEDQTERALKVFEESGHLKRPSKSDKESLKKRMKNARRWAELHGSEYRIEVAEKPDPEILSGLSRKQLGALREMGERLSGKPLTEDKLYNTFWDISKKHGIAAPQLFKAAYSVVINKDSGPRLAPFILAIGQKRVAEILRGV